MSKGNYSKSQSQTAGAAQKATKRGVNLGNSASIISLGSLFSRLLYVPVTSLVWGVCCCLENRKSVRKKIQWHHLHILFYFDYCLFLLFFINLPFSFLPFFLLILWCFGLLLVSVFSLIVFSVWGFIANVVFISVSSWPGTGDSQYLAHFTPGFPASINLHYCQKKKATHLPPFLTFNFHRTRPQWAIDAEGREKKKESLTEN
ncbi:hypothetical protein DFH27DRAFT_165236 [Peziza echinospora]|nr:hypothetical protein DFH27DRAFT_165236 [Peziza echinospora]